MSTLPSPLLSLLRKFISEFSLKHSFDASAHPRPAGRFASLLRAAAIPSLGYLLGWGPHFSSFSTSSDVKGSVGDDPNPVSPKDGGSESRKEEPKKRKEDQYDPNAPIYQLMNNPKLFEPTRAPRNPIVLAHGTIFLSWVHLRRVDAG